jgi:hypothetical protein
LRTLYGLLTRLHVVFTRIEAAMAVNAWRGSHHGQQIVTVTVARARRPQALRLGRLDQHKGIIDKRIQRRIGHGILNAACNGRLTNPRNDRCGCMNLHNGLRMRDDKERSNRAWTG